MCGIAGVAGEGHRSVRAMLEVMRHRGPDATEVRNLEGWNCVLGHVRLSILDLDPRSNQPFESPCGRFLLTFNGEIYNYTLLKDELEASGVRFQTTSDTEVLLHWLIHHGAAGVRRLEGMFAFCLADQVTGTLLLARDHIGEKPLYYAGSASRSQPGFAFASELQALLRLAWVDSSLDTEGLADYLRFLYTAAPHTLYAGIRELPPGHLARFDLRTQVLAIEQYYDLESSIDGEALARDVRTQPSSAADQFRQKFDQSVTSRLQSDVPVGLFLSGGMDSNAVAIAMPDRNRLHGMPTFTVRFDEALSRTGGDESGLAAESARFHGVQNRQVLFDAGASLMEAGHRVNELFGQPFGNATAIVTDQLSRLAAEHSRVCLVGDGGDELLAGYPRYRGLLLHRRMQSLPRPLLRMAAQASRLIRERGRSSTSIRRAKQLLAGSTLPMVDGYLRWITYTDADSVRPILGRTTETEFSSRLRSLFERHQKTPLTAAALVDFASFVPFNLMQSADRTGMRHSLELRCPFLAPGLIEFALSLPPDCKLQQGRTKPLLADAYADRWPPHIVNQPKRPFNPPVATWLRRQFECLKHELTNSSAELPGVVGRQLLNDQLGAFESGARDNSTLLWGLLSLEIWLGNRRSPARSLPHEPRRAA